MRAEAALEAKQMLMKVQEERKASEVCSVACTLVYGVWWWLLAGSCGGLYRARQFNENRCDLSTGLTDWLTD